MRAGLTILWDTIQLLRARMLFWVVMWVTVAIAVVYASLSIDEEGLSLFFGLWKPEFGSLSLGEPLGAVFYLLIFSDVIALHWLGFAVVALALIASCSVFPEMMREGAIETLLSKPVTRVKLFLVKFLGLLAFTAIPLTVFCLIVFFALGVRVGVWKAEIFFAVPILTLVFGILYSFAVMVGVISRSTLFALFATFLLWGGLFLVHLIETGFYRAVVLLPNAGIEMSMEPGAMPELHEESLPVNEGLKGLYDGFRGGTAFLPKPRKVTLLLRRVMVFDDELGDFAGLNLIAILMGNTGQSLERQAIAEADKRMGFGEVLYPSIGFTLICLGVGGFVFVRRDY
ncbi:MAG: ABC transporter permease subunit [Verrucomicrobiota bacterium]